MAASSTAPLSATSFYVSSGVSEVYLHSVPGATVVKFSLRELGSHKTYLSGQLNLVGGLTPSGLEQIFLSQKRLLLGTAVGYIEYFAGDGYVTSDEGLSAWKNRPFSDICKRHRDLVILLTSLNAIPMPLWETKTGGSVFLSNNPPTAEWLPVNCRFENKETGCSLRAIYVNSCANIGQLRWRLESELGEVSHHRWSPESHRISFVGLSSDVSSGIPSEQLVRHYLGQELVMMVEPVVEPRVAEAPMVEPETPAAMLERLLKMRDDEAKLKLKMDQLQTEKAELRSRLFGRITELTR